MRRVWLVIGSILSVGAVVCVLQDKMPSDVLAAALVAAIDRIFESRRDRNGSPQP